MEQHCCDDCRWFSGNNSSICWRCWKTVDVREIDPSIIKLDIKFNPRRGYMRYIGDCYKEFNKDGMCTHFSHKNIFIRLYRLMRKKEK